MITFTFTITSPASIRLDEGVLNTSSRRLAQDEFVRLSFMSSEDVIKTSSRPLGQDRYIRLGHMSSRRLQEVSKTPCKSVFKTL